MQATSPRSESVAERLASLETKLDFFLDHRKETDDYLSSLRLVVAALTTSVQGQTEEMKELHVSVRTLIAAEENVRSIAKDVALMKPIVADYVQKRDQAMGAAKAIRLMYGALVVLAGLLGFVASKSIERGWWN